MEYNCGDYRLNHTTILSRENDNSLTDIDTRLDELQTKLLKLANSKADYEDVTDEIYRLREQKQKAQVENAGLDELRKRIADMSSFLQDQQIQLLLLGTTECRPFGYKPNKLLLNFGIYMSYF